MMTPDWKRIEIENEDLIIKHIQQIGEGWSCLGYLVNETQVFKVPKLDCWDELAVEIEFLETLGEALPLSVPKPFFHRRESPATPFGYAVYSYLPGTEVDLISVSAWQMPAIIDTMAQFLRTLHDLAPTPKLNDIIYHEDHNELAKTAKRLRKAAETEIKPNLSPKAWDILQHEFEQHIAQYAQSFPLCLIHRDFCTDNMRMIDGQLTGVIDFGNMVLSDPDLDFAEIHDEFGEVALLETARRYGHRNPEGLLEKMARLSIINQVEVIIDDAEYAPDGVVEQCWAKLRRQLRN
ncbi:MAG: aminoglycoside phosphotransferase family protein [Chloroflexota bacterium]